MQAVAVVAVLMPVICNASTSGAGLPIWDIYEYKTYRYRSMRGAGPCLLCGLRVVNGGLFVSGDCKRSRCPVAGTLDLLGDRWTLLVVRDLLLGRHTYKELQESPERIPSNLLADRLKRLQREGVVRREPYQQHPPRYSYHLTDKGRDLGPVLHAMLDWGSTHVPGTVSKEEVEALLNLPRRND